VSLSGGGNSPLAILSDYGRRLVLTWPGRLPEPSIAGPTATYRNVYPGIDLALTASAQGDVAEVVIVRNAAAAANPELARALRLQASAPGMRLSAHDGGITLSASAAGAPVFTAPEARMWDSAGPPVRAKVARIQGRTVALPSGTPAFSSIAGPGAFASTHPVPLAVTGSMIRMIVPPDGLSRARTVFPVYIDPGFEGAQYSHDASAWTQIDHGLPSDDSDWDETGSLTSGPLLQVGYCDPGNLSGCGGIGVTRSMFRLPLYDLANNATVRSADIVLTDAWSADCDSEPLQLWTTPAISSSSDWNSAGTWNKEVEQETYAGYGHAGCGYSTGNVVFGNGSTATGGSASALASSLTSAIDSGATTETLGIRAADESTTDGSAWLQWRQFGDSYNGKSYITLEADYSTPPTPPTISTNPGGTCQGAKSAPTIGNDDITVAGVTHDGDGDSGLNTDVTVYNSSNLQQYSFDFPVSGAGTPPGSYELGTIPRGTLTANGLYRITAVTTDSFGGIATTNCYFQLNLSAPQPPEVTGVPDSVTIGERITGVTFSPPTSENCSANPDPCPVTYRYQIGYQRPVSVSAGADGTWTLASGKSITIPVLGPFIFNVVSIDAAGNISLASQVPVISTLPVSGSGQPVAVPDGYYSDDSYPDLLTTDSGAADASLWLSRGTADGQVELPTDIGGLGTDINPGADGPADWNGAAVLHGDFTGQYFQDVMAYYATGNGTHTSPGTGTIIQGAGNTSPVSPYSGDTATAAASDWCDPALDSGCENGGPTPAPADLVYAGNAGEGYEPASLASTNDADVIGVFAYGASSDLNLYTANETGIYSIAKTLSAASPDGTDDWQDYTLATAELPDTASPDGDPSNTVLLAFDSHPGTAGAGHLYESVNSGCAAGTCSATAVIGTTGTWTPVTAVPSSWTTTPPKLISADVNNSTGTSAGAGKLEIWTQAGNTVQAYTITGTTPALTAEGTGSALSYPDDSWAMNDGGANPGTTGPSTATDSITGSQGPISGTTHTWAADVNFGTVLDTGPSSTANSYLAPPAGTIPTSDADPTLSLWFQTTSQAGGILASLQSAALSSGTTTVANYDPVLYIGSDGILQAEWWNGGANPLSSASTVNDGQWHHAVLSTTTSGSTTTQTLTLDGVVQGTMTGAVSLTSATSSGNPDTNLTFGDGYIGGRWPDEPNYLAVGGPGSPGYFFAGDIANATFTQ
jgi:hypothetical protein